MLLHLDNFLYTQLSSMLMYNQSQDGAEALSAANDATVRVVRWNCSEYHALYDDGTVPFIAIQLLGDNYEDPHRGVPPSAQIWDYTDDTRTDVAINWHPVPVDVSFQLEIISPDDLWLQRIKKTIAQYFWRRLVVRLTLQGLGPQVGDQSWPSTFTLLNPRMIGDLNGGGAMVRKWAETQRFFRAVLPLEAGSWLTSPDSRLDLWKVYKTAQVDFIDLSNEQTLETVTFQ